MVADPGGDAQTNAANEPVSLDEVARVLSVERDLAIALGRARDLDTALEAILAAALSLPPLDSGGLYLFDKDDNLYLATHRGLTPAFIAETAFVDHDATRARLARHGEPVFAEYTAVAPSQSDAQRAEGLRAIGVIPVRDGERTVAVLNVASHTQPTLPHHVRDALVTIGSQIGAVVERVRVDAAVRASQADFQALFDSLNDFLFVLDDQGRIVHTNSVVERRLGYTRDELLGRSVLFVHPPPRHQEALRIVGEMLQGVNTYCPIPLVAKDGTPIPVETVVSHGKWNGKPAILGISRDISRRKHAEDALRDSEARYRMIAERTSDGILWFDEENRVRYISPANLAQLGMKESDEPLQSLRGLKSIIHADDRDRVFDDFARAMARREPQIVYTYRAHHADGHLIWREDSAQLVFDPEDGRYLGAYVVGRDITERHHAEETRHQLEEQLLQAQKMETVGRLAGGVAHDFNNMLAVILGNIEMASEQLAPDSPLQADLKEIREAASRSADLTAQLLAFARKQVIVPKRLDLNETVRNLLHMLQRLIGENIAIAWRPAGGLWPVRLDPTQVDQILINLCVNARDAIHDIGHVTIETHNRTITPAECAARVGFLPGDYVELVVSDDGCGMDKETLAHAFEPFFTTKPLGRGTGLGLATVYGMVAQNGGFVDASSQPGAGATFRLFLPRHLDQRSGSDRRHGHAAAPGGTETILVVEDEPAILRITQRMLERHGYSVLSAETPAEAIALAERPGGIDLLMTDLVMPGMNGMDLSRALRARAPHLRVLFMSGYTANVIAQYGVMDEGTHFLSKPFSVADLASAVRRALDAVPAE